MGANGSWLHPPMDKMSSRVVVVPLKKRFEQMKILNHCTFPFPALQGACGLFAALSLLTLLARPSLAQTESVDPLEDLSTQDYRDPFFGSSNGQSGVFDIIHRAQLGSSISPDEYSETQQENLSTEAEQFRLRRQELLKQQGAAVEPTPSYLVPEE